MLLWKSCCPAEWGCYNPLVMPVDPKYLLAQLFNTQQGGKKFKNARLLTQNMDFRYSHCLRASIGTWNNYTNLWVRLQQKDKYPEEYRTKLRSKCHNCLVIRERIKRCEGIGKAVEGGYHRAAERNY